MATIELRMKMVHGDIQAILNRAKQKDAPVVRLRDLAFALLRKNKLSYKARFHCRQVGFNPRNRSQVGIEPQENTRRLRKYRRSGWSNIECSNAAATERAPGARGDAIEKKNIEVVEQSAGKIASVLPGSLKIFTITCGHTNQALRAGDAELPSTEEDLSLNGKLNKVKICGDDQDYLEAMTIGMEWTVIPWQIEQKYPELIDLIIEADNVPVTAARADNIVERLFKIQKIAKEASLSGNTDWNLIANIANRSELQRPEEEVAQLVSFVKSSSGGLENPFVLREIDNWAKTLPFLRDCPPSVLALFVSIDLGPGGAGFWRAACVKLMLSSEDRFTTSKNESKYFSTQDINNMGRTTRPMVLQANEMMEKARTVMSKVDDDISVSKQAELLGRFDVRLVGHVMKRPVLGTYKSLADIGLAFWVEFKEVLEANGSSTVGSCPWGKPDKTEAAPGQSVKSITAFSAGSGSLKASDVSRYFAEKGLKIGSTVQQLSVDDGDGTHVPVEPVVTWKVMSIGKATVELAEVKGLLDTKKGPPKTMSANVNDFYVKFKQVEQEFKDRCPTN